MEYYVAESFTNLRRSEVVQRRVNDRRARATRKADSAASSVVLFPVEVVACG
jgi:hypothetical protein